MKMQIYEVEDKHKKSPSRKQPQVRSADRAHSGIAHFQTSILSFLKARNGPQIILRLTSNEKHRHNHLLASQMPQLMILVKVDTG